LETESFFKYSRVELQECEGSRAWSIARVSFRCAKLKISSAFKQRTQSAIIRPAAQGKRR
jgi:hypothetical protein